MTFSSFGPFSGLILELLPTPNSRGVGALRFLGEVRVHENSEGTAPSLKYILPAKDFLRLFSLKCLEQTFVDVFISMMV